MGIGGAGDRRDPLELAQVKAWMGAATVVWFAVNVLITGGRGKVPVAVAVGVAEGPAVGVIVGVAAGVAVASGTGKTVNCHARETLLPEVSRSSNKTTCVPGSRSAGYVRLESEMIDCDVTSRPSTTIRTLLTSTARSSV